MRLERGLRNVSFTRQKWIFHEHLQQWAKLFHSLIKYFPKGIVKHDAKSWGKVRYPGDGNHSIRRNHDSSSIHISHPTKVYLIKKDAYILDWTPRSPDLNPSENVFGLLAQRFYRGKDKISCVAEFKETKKKQWMKISLEKIRSFVANLNFRLTKVLMNHSRRYVA